MPLVTVTYKAWDHNRKIIPSAQQPRVGFKPLASDIAAAGLLTDREVFGTLDPNTGEGSVQLESEQGIMYQPFMDWLIDDNASAPSNQAREYSEWDPIFPGQGGPIDQLPSDATALSGVWFGYGDPPDVLRRRSDVTYWDVRGVGTGNPVLWIDTRFAVVGGA